MSASTGSSKFRDSIEFLHCLHFAIVNSEYSNIILKPKQVLCLEAVYHGQDLLAVLPTGYGKSLIFQLLSSLIAEKNRRTDVLEKPVIIVISPLNSLISDQLQKINRLRERAVVLSVKGHDSHESEDREQSLDLTNVDASRLKKGDYEYIFTHPETCLSSKQGVSLFQGNVYKNYVAAVVVDEAHCILEWGNEFRTDYSQLGMLGAFFPNAVMIALTATANGMDRVEIEQSLHMDNPVEIIGNPDRANIFYSKILRISDELMSYESILRPIAVKLLEENVNYPLTIVYLPLRWCGFAYKLFESILGKAQYYPLGSVPDPERRLFAQYHAPQTLAMKEMIIQQLTSKSSTVRIVFATVAIGMGVDIPNIRVVIHIGPPSSVQMYFQETGRAGRDGLPSKAILYYNNRDIARNRHIGKDMINFCKIEDQCLRKFLLNYLQCGKQISPIIGHNCCSFCLPYCQCPDCSIF